MGSTHQEDVMTSMKNKNPWYIWLSIPMFLILYLDTAGRIKLIRKGKGESNKAERARHSWERSALWNKFWWLMVRLMFGYIAATAFALNGLSFLIQENFGEHWYSIINIFITLCMYLIGVLVTSKLCKWRQKHIPHLMDKIQLRQPKQND